MRDPDAALAGAASPRSLLARLGSVAARALGGGRRSASAARDLASASIPATLWFLAWPHSVEGVLRIADDVVDLALAGLGFGHKAIAGMGAAQQFSQLGFTARWGLGMGMRA